mgnify:FL=1
MRLDSYNCPVCGGKRGRQFNHEKCSQVLKAASKPKRKRDNRNYEYLQGCDLNTQHLRLE